MLPAGIDLHKDGLVIGAGDASGTAAPHQRLRVQQRRSRAPGWPTDAGDAHDLTQGPREEIVPRAHLISPGLRGGRGVLRLAQKRGRYPNAITTLLARYIVPSIGELPELA